jgi:hypothetical protein
MPSRCPYQLFLHDGERLRNFACERVRDRFGKRDTGFERQRFHDRWIMWTGDCWTV